MYIDMTGVNPNVGLTDNVILVCCEASGGK
jgi:hypothetical protein